MAKIYRKRPFDVEVIKWTGDNYEEVGSFIPVEYRIFEHGVLRIATLEGWLKASRGDYIVKGIEGEFYPVKASIFERSYVEVTLPEKVPA